MHFAKLVACAAWVNILGNHMANALAVHCTNHISKRSSKRFTTNSRSYSPPCHALLAWQSNFLSTAYSVNNQNFTMEPEGIVPPPS